MIFRIIAVLLLFVVSRLSVALDNSSTNESYDPFAAQVDYISLTDEESVFEPIGRKRAFVPHFNVEHPAKINPKGSEIQELEAEILQTRNEVMIFEQGQKIREYQGQNSSLKRRIEELEKSQKYLLDSNERKGKKLDDCSRANEKNREELAKILVEHRESLEKNEELQRKYEELLGRFPYLKNEVVNLRKEVRYLKNDMLSLLNTTCVEGENREAEIEDGEIEECEDHEIFNKKYEKDDYLKYMKKQ